MTAPAIATTPADQTVEVAGMAAAPHKATAAGPPDAAERAPDVAPPTGSGPGNALPHEPPAPPCARAVVPARGVPRHADAAPATRRPVADGPGRGGVRAGR